MTNGTEYLTRLKRFCDFYLALVISCAMLCAVGIVVAILLNLAIGILIAVLGAVLYAVILPRRAYSLLGLRVKSVRGGIHVARADCEDGDTLFIPDRIMWADVTAIEDGAFASEKNANVLFVHLPATLERIGKDVFGERAERITVFFEGSESAWERLSKQTDFDGVTVMCSAPLPKLEKKKRGRAKNTETEADL